MTCHMHQLNLSNSQTVHQVWTPIWTFLLGRREKTNIFFQTRRSSAEQHMFQSHFTENSFCRPLLAVILLYHCCCSCVISQLLIFSPLNSKSIFPWSWGPYTVCNMIFNFTTWPPLFSNTEVNMLLRHKTNLLQLMSPCRFCSKGNHLY